MDRKTYVVTERAGPKVAGQRVTKGEELELTAEEARSELLEGAIVEKGKDLHQAYTETTKKAEAALEAAKLDEDQADPPPPGETAPAGAGKPPKEGSSRPA